MQLWISSLLNEIHYVADLRKSLQIVVLYTLNVHAKLGFKGLQLQHKILRFIPVLFPKNMKSYWK